MATLGGGGRIMVRVLVVLVVAAEVLVIAVVAVMADVIAATCPTMASDYDVCGARVVPVKVTERRAHFLVEPWAVAGAIWMIWATVAVGVIVIVVARNRDGM